MTTQTEKISIHAMLPKGIRVRKGKKSTSLVVQTRKQVKDGDKIKIIPDFRTVKLDLPEKYNSAQYEAAFQALYAIQGTWNSQFPGSMDAAPLEDVDLSWLSSRLEISHCGKITCHGINFCLRDKRSQILGIVCSQKMQCQDLALGIISLVRIDRQ